MLHLILYKNQVQLDGNGNRVGSSNSNSVEVPSHDEEEAKEEWERREQIEATLSPISSDNEEEVDDEIVQEEESSCNNRRCKEFAPLAKRRCKRVIKKRM